MRDSRFCRVAALLALVVAGSAGGAAAQPLLDRPAGLLARIDGVLQPLDIRRADIRVSIDGRQAITTTTLVFGNPYDRELEGEMVFPVPPDASITGFGLDVDGAIVDAVAVERQAARVAYGVQVQRKVDPALLESVRGNVFRTRVFPIPRGGERSVRVRYLTELTSGEDTTRPVAVLHVPLAHMHEARRIDIRIDAPDAGVPAELSGVIHFLRQDGRQIGVARVEAPAIPDEITIHVPIASSGTAVTGTGPDGLDYFLIDDYPVPPANVVANERSRRVGLVWDASLSRAAADTAREMGLVERWLRQLGDVDVELTVLREIAEPVRRFAIRNQDPSRLLAALRELPYDGGTRLDLLPACPGCAYQVVFTDGQSMFAESLPPLDGMPPLHIVAGGQRSDHALLREMARATGGSFVDLSGSEDEIVSSLGRRRFSLLSIHAGVGVISSLVVPAPDASSGHVSVSGRLNTRTAAVTLEYGWQPGQVVMRRTVRLRRDGNGRELPALTWAARTAARLGLLPEKNHGRLQRLGLSFNLATPATSLLVLENVRQYLTNGIAPPRSRPALYAEYQQRHADWDAWRKFSTACAQKRQLNLIADGWRRHILEADGVEDPDDGRPAPERKLGRGTASVSGRVTDAAGEGLPGTEIEIADRCGGGVRRVTTGNDGRYQARGIPDGNYRVRASLIGFAWEDKETPLRPQHRSTIDLTLRVGALDERIVISDYADPIIPPAQDDERPDVAMELTPWDPKTPYLGRLNGAAPRDWYRTYLVERQAYSRSPAFYLDCADFFLTHGNRSLARRLLTDVVELDPGNVRLLRVAAHRLQSAGDSDLAVMLFEKVRTLLPVDLQARRDLALALADRADRRRKRVGSLDGVVVADLRRAMRLHGEILTGAWDGWFNEHHILALTDLNRIRVMLRSNGIAAGRELPLDARLARPIDADLRVVLTWDDDAAELYLIVREPNGEESSPTIDQATGSLHVDLSSRYGPSEYLVRKALKGPYEVQVSRDDSTARDLLGPTTVRATIATDFGRPTERLRQVTLRLATEEDEQTLGTVVLSGSPSAKIRR